MGKGRANEIGKKKNSEQIDAKKKLKVSIVQ